MGAISAGLTLSKNLLQLKHPADGFCRYFMFSALLIILSNKFAALHHNAGYERCISNSIAITEAPMTSPAMPAGHPAAAGSQMQPTTASVSDPGMSLNGIAAGPTPESSGQPAGVHAGLSTAESAESHGVEAEFDFDSLWNWPVPPSGSTCAGTALGVMAPQPPMQVSGAIPGSMPAPLQRYDGCLTLECLALALPFEYSPYNKLSA